MYLKIKGLFGNHFLNQFSIFWNKKIRKHIWQIKNNFLFLENVLFLKMENKFSKKIF